MAIKIQKILFLPILLIFLCSGSFANFSSQGIAENTIYFSTWIGSPIVCALLYLIGVVLYSSFLNSNKTNTPFLLSKFAKIFFPAGIGALIGTIIGAQIYIFYTFAPYPYNAIIFIPLIPLVLIYFICFYTIILPVSDIGSTFNLGQQVSYSVVYVIYLVSVIVITTILTLITQRLFSIKIKPEIKKKSTKK